METHGRHCPPFHGNLAKNSNVFIHVCQRRTKTTSFERFQTHMESLMRAKNNNEFYTLKFFKKIIHPLIKILCYDIRVESSASWGAAHRFVLLGFVAFQLCITSSIRLGCLRASYFVLHYLCGVSLCICIFFHYGFPCAQTTATPVTHFEGN